MKTHTVESLMKSAKGCASERERCARALFNCIEYHAGIAPKDLCRIAWTIVRHPLPMQFSDRSYGEKGELHTYDTAVHFAWGQIICRYEHPGFGREPMPSFPPGHVEAPKYTPRESKVLEACAADWRALESVMR